MTKKIKNLFLIPVSIWILLVLPRAIGLFFGVGVDNKTPLVSGFLYFYWNLAYAFMLAALFYLFKKVNFKGSSALIVGILAASIAINIAAILIYQHFGITFNSSFFVHFDWQNFKIAFDEYWRLFIAYGVFVITFWFLVRKIYRETALTVCRPLLNFGIGFSLALGSILMCRKPHDFWPVFKFADGLYRQYTRIDVIDAIKFTSTERDFLAQIGIDDTDPEVLLNETKSSAPKSKMNVLIIFIESLQSTLTSYGNDKLPGLTPNYDQFIKENLYFSNYYSAASNTVSGLVAGLCSILPIDTTYEASTVSKMANLCLPSILNKQGYQQAFLSGDSIQHAGKAQFAHNVHFDLVEGKEGHLQRHPEYQSAQSVIGIHDDKLFDTVLEHMDAMKSPFHISVLTTDTHRPGFLSPECQKYDFSQNKNSASFSPYNKHIVETIFCFDQALGKFVKKLKEKGYYENTLIVFTADHHFHMRDAKDEEYIGLFTEPSEVLRRRLPLAIHVPKQNAKIVDTVGISTDLSSTVLELLGYNTKHILAGHSLISSRTQHPHMFTEHLEIDAARHRFNYGYIEEECNKEGLLTAILKPTDNFVSICERKKILTFVQKVFFLGPQNSKVTSL